MRSPAWLTLAVGLLHPDSERRLLSPPVVRGGETGRSRAYRMSRFRQNVFVLACPAWLLFGGIWNGRAQWVPPPSLQNVPVREDCTKTNGGIGIAFQPTLFNPHGAIFLCPKRAIKIDRAHPGSSFFFRVHEYGHLALHTRNEALADAWAAEQLSHSTAGRTTLNRILLYFSELGKRFAPTYGSGYDRALTVAESGRIPDEEWPSPVVEYRRILNEKRARNGTIQLRMVDQNADGLLWVDDQLVGFVSTVDGCRDLPVPDLQERTHRVRIQDVWVSEMRSPNQLIAKGLDASALFQGGNSTGGLSIDLNYQAESLTIYVAK
jgi:hypothetical protein